MLHFRKASINDMSLYYEWVNDKLVREYSYNTQAIDLQKHENWFKQKLIDPDCLMLIFYNDLADNIGQVRFQKQNENSAIIGVSIDQKQRGKGYSKKILKIASDFYLDQFNEIEIEAYIKKSNIFSIQSFERAGFKYVKSLFFQNIDSLLYRKTKQCK
jgi:RimJ/RimL family protein N-acetyltransferase